MARLTQTDKIDKLFKQTTRYLPMYNDEIDDYFKRTNFLTNENRDQILSADMEEVETIANLFDQIYGMGVCTIGDYEYNGNYTGLFYVSIS